MADVLELFDQLAQGDKDGNQAHDDAGAQSDVLLEVDRIVRDSQANQCAYEWCDGLLSGEYPTTDDVSKASDHDQLNAIMEKHKVVQENRRTLAERYHETVLMQQLRFRDVEQKMAEEKIKLAEERIKLAEERIKLAEVEIDLTKRRLAMIMTEAELDEKKSKLDEDRARFGEEVTSRQEQADDATVREVDIEKHMKHMAVFDKPDIGFDEFFNAVAAETNVANASVSEEAPSSL